MVDVFAVCVTSFIVAVPGVFAIGAYRRQRALVRRWDQRVIYSAAEAGRRAQQKAHLGHVKWGDVMAGISTIESVLRELETGKVDLSVVDSQLTLIVDGYTDLAATASDGKAEERALAETLIARTELLEAVRTGTKPIQPGHRLLPSARPLTGTPPPPSTDRAISS